MTQDAPATLPVHCVECGGAATLQMCALGGTCATQTEPLTVISCSSGYAPTAKNSMMLNCPASWRG